MSEAKIPPDHADKFITQLSKAFADGDPLAAEKRAEVENLRVLEDQYRAIGAGDFASALAVLAEDVEMEIDCPPVFAFAGRWRGRDAVAEAIGKNFALVADQRPEIESVIAQGDTVVLVGRETGKYRPTDQWYEVRWVHLHTFKHGRVVRFREIVGHAVLTDYPPG
jgi:ketosteroid isomerase-like protein